MNIDQINAEDFCDARVITSEEIQDLADSIQEIKKDPLFQEQVKVDDLNHQLQEVKEKLTEIHEILDDLLGYTSPKIHEMLSDKKIKEDMPIYWCTKEIKNIADKIKVDS